MYFDIISIGEWKGMASKKTVTSNNSTVSISGAKIIGNNNDIFGDDNEIIGNNNDIEGHNNKCMGNNLDVVGDWNEVHGNNNDVEGFGCTVTGNNCDYARKKKPKKLKLMKEKSISEQLDDMLADARGEAPKIERLWNIDNVNLTDEEYKQVEEYMESIRTLWQIW